jgi:hypothetical protein
MNDYDIQEILWRALETPVGLEVESSDIEAFKRRLYSVRNKAREKGNDSFNCLQFITPPLIDSRADTRLWIVKDEEARLNGARKDTSTEIH